ncbi:ATP-binding protein [Dyadobacter sp. LHD-138]|uniref:GAF domain-containing sensor histidine kinase n=1 Tax=Dyadobacter sp. LHD-138 TaxID=3071413 RepID=UPI0027DEE1CD|nr:ATP-binding protein [Dyadobacter sp. LHD-138]MDQ6481320.1 ATP-binding protein [Dyadobacter sp. LHD-138]
MNYTDASLALDIENIKQIPIVPTMLEVICRSTGMGFAAIARVTQDRWIACDVRDEIGFGLVSGGELKIETTICNEIRDMREAVVIDHVDKSEVYHNHHTPKLYGLQSYISFPIIKKNGDFFGTLCAIDPNPAELNNPKIMGMFSLFAELISFHLQSADLLERSNVAVKELKRQLTDSLDENRQYRYISHHNLQEPLRKIRMFSNMLVNATDTNDNHRTKDFALKINSNAQRFSMMIKDLSDFSDLDHQKQSFEKVDLNKVITDVRVQLSDNMEEKNATFDSDTLPSIQGIPSQIEQLFYHLIHNAIKFSKKDKPLHLRVTTKRIPAKKTDHALTEQADLTYAEIRLEDNGIGIEKSQLEKIFDIFSQLPHAQIPEGKGVGLAYCRKIVRIHGGAITAESESDTGTIFSIVLPVITE